MIDFRTILQAYTEAYEALIRKETNAEEESERSRWRRLGTLNDYAYFILLFEQLENHVNDECHELIKQKKEQSDWRARRLWDQMVSKKGSDDESADITIPRMQNARLPFMSRVALLTEKEKGDYSEVKSLYNYRNQIAHGFTTSISGFDLADVAQRIDTLKSRLKK